MEKFYFGNIGDWTDASANLSRLHALCDIVNSYAEESNDDENIKKNNIVFALQIMHDLSAALEEEFDMLADEEFDKLAAAELAKSAAKN